MTDTQQPTTPSTPGGTKTTGRRRSVGEAETTGRLKQPGSVPKPRHALVTEERQQPDLEVVGAGLHPVAVDPLANATILIVGLNYAPEDVGIAPHTTLLARGLAEIAGRITVFTGIPHQPAGFLPMVYRRDRRSYSWEGGVQVVRHRHHVPSGGVPSGAGRISSTGLAAIGLLRYETSFIRAVLDTPARDVVPDLVIGVTPSVGGAVAAAGLASRFRVPLLIVAHDLLDGSASGPLGGLIARGLSRAQGKAVRQASQVLIADEEHRAVLCDLGVPADRITVRALPDTLPDVLRRTLRRNSGRTSRPLPG